jgi:hypothetical protein
VVWATEYRTDYSWLHVPGVIVDGAVRHDAGATDVRGLYFLGLPWQACRGSALLGFVGADAATVSDRMAADAVGQPQPIGAPRMSARLASPPPATRPRTPGAKAIPAASVVDGEHRGPTPARSYLLTYLHDLTVLLGGPTLLLFGWNWASSTTWAAGHPWPAAVAATTGWALGVAGWLRRRGWPGARLHAVSWAAPVAVLVPLTWPGWISPDGLLLWAPLTTVLAVALGTRVA